MTPTPTQIRAIAEKLAKKVFGSFKDQIMSRDGFIYAITEALNGTEGETVPFVENGEQVIKHVTIDHRNRTVVERRPGEPVYVPPRTPAPSLAALVAEVERLLREVAARLHSSNQPEPLLPRVVDCANHLASLASRVGEGELTDEIREKAEEFDRWMSIAHRGVDEIWDDIRSKPAHPEVIALSPEAKGQVTGNMAKWCTFAKSKERLIAYLERELSAAEKHIKEQSTLNDKLTAALARIAELEVSVKQLPSEVTPDRETGVPATTGLFNASEGQRLELERIILMISQFKETSAQNPGDLKRMEITGFQIFLQRIIDRLAELEGKR